MLALALVTTAAPAVAQTASPYIPMDHWAMPAIEHLIRAGIIIDPDPLTRPLREAAVAAALEHADSTGWSAATTALVHRLRAAFPVRAPGADGAYTGEFWLGGDAVTDAVRDPLRASGGGGVNSIGGMMGTATYGPVSLSSRGYWDGRIHGDPDYRGAPNGPVPGRFDQAYLSVQAGPLEAVLGNLDRNWGDPDAPGLLVSNVPYSYDHFYLRLETPHVGMQLLVTQFDDMSDSTTGLVSQRHWVAERVSVRPDSTWSIWVDQGLLLTGPNRQLELWALNPFRVSQFSAEDENREAGTNAFVQGTLRYAPRGGPIVTASLLVDDIDFHLESESASNIPWRLGGTATIAGHLGANASWSGLYTFVSNLAYRTFNAPEALLDRGIGVARAISDYDQLTARLTTPVPGGLLAGGEFTLLRRGAGDIHEPFPPSDAQPAPPFLFAGVVERTWRLAASLDAEPLRGLHVAGVAGYHLIENTAHVSGITSHQVVASLTATFHLGIRSPQP